MPIVAAWRNLWRNRRRTAITLAAVASSTLMLILSQGLMQGLLVNALHNATDLFVGDVQIHADGYLARRSFYDSIEEPEALLAAADEGGWPAVARAYGYGLVAHQTKSAGAQFISVDPVAEREVFRLAQHVASGDWLSEGASQEIVLGRKLARTLDATVGAEIVVVVQAADGSLGNELYAVRGILKNVNEAIDRGAVILHRTDFDALFVSGGRVHEIALNVRGTVDPEEVARTLSSIAPSEDVRAWRRLLPVLSDMMIMMDSFLWVFGSIFFLAAGLGVLNTMLMATHERMHELGVLKAIGTPPWRIVRDVAIEAALLGIVAAGIGAVVGGALTGWLAYRGIDLGAWAGDISFSGVAFDPVWRPVLSTRGIYEPAIILSLTTIAAALYPAILAARLDPIEALRRK